MGGGLLLLLLAGWIGIFLGTDNYLARFPAAWGIIGLLGGLVPIGFMGRAAYLMMTNNKKADEFMQKEADAFMQKKR